LVQLNSTPSASYNVYYNGWDKSGSSSSSGVAIHHPAGDIKKISTYNSTLTSATWNGSGYIGATNAHWRAFWIATSNGHGVNEGGSSGSPIFNSSGRILGTLTGGSSSCSHTNWSDLYGKFSYHWQSNGSSSPFQLKPWLDPNSSGVTYLDGYDPNANNPPVADFEADNTTPGVGQSVNFTDLSSDDPTSWSWSFDPPTVTYVGGTNSSYQNPQVQFNVEGSYEVSLTASNAYGSDNETKTNYIDVSLYCDASGASDYMEIVRVELGSIDNSSGQEYYGDFTYLSTDLAKNQSYDITITNGFIVADADLSVWIDWNQDGTFNSTDEHVVCEVSNEGQGTYNFTIPAAASTGSTRMRIRTKYTGDNCGEPCGTTDFGEVEDYSVNVIPGIDLDITVFLEGPFNSGMMNTDLIPLLPKSQPFNVDPWFYPGTETVADIPGTGIVDWILIELREATTASLADGTTDFDWQAAFLRNDGKIVHLDGNSILHFSSSVTDSLYVVIHQRNHLNIMTAFGLEESGGIYSYDFSISAEKAYGSAAQKVIGVEIWGMFGGDGNQDGVVNALDKSPLWDSEAGTKDYLDSDYNLDGESDNQDKNGIWLPNEGQSKQVPD